MGVLRETATGDDEVIANLREVQHALQITVRDAHCTADAEYQDRSGIMVNYANHTINYTSCLIRITEARTEELRATFLKIP